MWDDSMKKGEMGCFVKKRRLECLDVGCVILIIAKYKNGMRVLEN